MKEKIQNDAYMTGTAYDFDRATTSLTQKLLSSPKKVTIVRHGLSSWNEESRIQVCSFSAQIVVDKYLFTDHYMKLLAANLITIWLPREAQIYLS